MQDREPRTAMIGRRWIDGGAHARRQSRDASIRTKCANHGLTRTVYMATGAAFARVACGAVGRARACSDAVRGCEVATRVRRRFRKRGNARVRERSGSRQCAMARRAHRRIGEMCAATLRVT